MTLWIAMALVIIAGVIVLWWFQNRYDSLGRSKPFPSISIGIVLLLIAACLTPFVLRIRLENQLAEAAGKITGSEVSVHCQSFGEAFADLGAELGYVKFGPDGVPEKATLIKRDQCHDLSAYLKSDKLYPSQEQIVAVHTLTHEAIHMSGVTSESQTECIAVQHDSEMARLLGAPPEGAQTLSLQYWRTVYPRMPDAYKSAECGPGLTLDAGLPDAPWLLADAAR